MICKYVWLRTHIIKTQYSVRGVCDFKQLNNEVHRLNLTYRNTRPSSFLYMLLNKWLGGKISAQEARTAELLRIKIGRQLTLDRPKVRQIQPVRSNQAGKFLWVGQNWGKSSLFGQKWQGNTLCIGPRNTLLATPLHFVCAFLCVQFCRVYIFGTILYAALLLCSALCVLFCKPQYGWILIRLR